MSISVNFYYTIHLLVSLHACVFPIANAQYGLYSNVIFTWVFIRILNFNQNTIKHAMFNEAKPNCAEPIIKNNKQQQQQQQRQPNRQRKKEQQSENESERDKEREGENRVKSI